MQAAIRSRCFRNLCWECRTYQGPRKTISRRNPASKPTYLSFHLQRAFTTSSQLQKKGGKGQKQQYDASDTPADSSKAPLDPGDFTELEQNLTKAHAKLKEDLSKLRSGGRFNTELIDELRVSLEKDTKNTMRLGDLAQVVPRGRTVNIMVGEKEHIRPIMSAIQGSDLSLSPQPDAQNPLQLNITIPPPTAESRQQAVKAATKAAETATQAVRNARQIQHKKLRQMTLDKTARPDHVKKADDKMGKVVDAAIAEVKKIADSAKKVLETA